MKTTQPGIRKVAILVASLDTRAADAVLDQMSDERAAEVRNAIMDMGDIDPAEQKRVVDEFFKSGGKGDCPPLCAAPSGPSRQRGTVPFSSGGVELDESLARRIGMPTTPRRPSSVDTNHDGPRPFAALVDAEADKLASLLSIERPQTIALVLAHLMPEQSGAVLVRLPATLQADVVRRLVDLEEADPEILKEIEAALAARLSRQVTMQRRRVAGMQAVSGILESCAGAVGMQILDNLRAHDQTLAERFTPPAIDFDDLADLDDASLVEVFRAAGEELAQLALIGAAPRLVNRIIRRLPVEQAAALRQAIELPGVIRLSDVEEARAEMAEIARQLAAQGRIRLPRRHALEVAA